MIKEDNYFLHEISNAASRFLNQFNEKKVFAFFGEMGVGKTTFIKAICKELGVIDVVNSPSFSIVNEYQTNKKDKIYHIDFYRIEKLEEIYDFGYEDYLYSNQYCFIEWPEKAQDILPLTTVSIFMKENPNGSRQIKIKL